GISNVIGPYKGKLSNNSGKKSNAINLYNRGGALLLQVPYDTRAPWPLAADGTGHSLVLARPTYGEGGSKALPQADVFEGSPGIGDAVRFEPVRSVMINEFFANSVFPDVDYLELYNHSAQPVDLSGCWLSDTAGTNKFRIPDNTMIGPTGFV